MLHRALWSDLQLPSIEICDKHQENYSIPKVKYRDFYMDVQFVTTHMWWALVVLGQMYDYWSDI